MEPRQQSPMPGSNSADLSTTNERGAQDADASVHAQAFRRPRVLLAVSGSVAAIKAPQLLLELGRFAEVQVVASAAALHFLGTVTLPAEIRVHQDEDDWRSWQAVGDAVLHIDLRRWADAMVVAPLSANTLSKMAAGACDNLLTCVVRAWDFAKPLLVAPAMNTLMWRSPFTSKHLEVLTELGVAVVPPVIKVLACGDHGDGAMASPAAIAQRCREALSQQGFDLPDQ